MKTRFIIAPFLVAAFSTSVLSAQPPDDTASFESTSTGAIGSEICKHDMSQSDRLAAVDKVIAESKAELTKNPESIKNSDVRARIGTFAAGAMDDETVFVSLDRWCWAEFYEAQQHLAAKAEAKAFESAQDWKVCLEASFPDRIDLAKPYFSCFPGLNKSKAKTK